LFVVENLPSNSQRGTWNGMFLCIPIMLKQVIFWCAVFVVAVTSAVLIGEMGSRRQGTSAQPVSSLVSTAEGAMEQVDASEQSTAQHGPTLDAAAEPYRHSDR
jgi:hypothetical protein